MSVLEKTTTKAPQLRFPGFSEEWTNKKIGDLCSNGDYGMNSSAKDFDGVNKYLRITDIDESSHKFSKDDLKSPASTLSDKYLLSMGDIVFARTGASVGKTYLYDREDGRVYFAGYLIRFSVDKADPRFVFLQTLRRFYKDWVTKTSARSGQPGINSEEYKKLILAVPEKAEQEKIADFLSAVDEKIDLENKKLENLEKYKKSITQQIFTQELRFSGFSEDWRETRLKSIGDFYRGLSYSKSNVMQYGNLVVRSNNIKAGKLNTSSDLQFVDKEIPNDIRLINNDIVVCMANGSKELVGKSASYNDDYVGNITVGAFCSIFRPKSVIAKYIFSTNQYRSYLHMLLTGTNINNLKNSDLANLIFKVPSSVEEQQKIADFLSSIDEKLDLQKTKLDHLKNFKKSLIQRMFV